MRDDMTSEANTTWARFVKKAGYISPDRTTFKIPPGKTIGHVVQENNTMFPNFRISAGDIQKANGNLDSRRFMAGKEYKMPTGAFSDGFKQFMEDIVKACKMRGIDVSKAMSNPIRTNPGAATWKR